MVVTPAAPAADVTRTDDAIAAMLAGPPGQSTTLSLGSVNMLRAAPPSAPVSAPEPELPPTSPAPASTASSETQTRGSPMWFVADNPTGPVKADGSPDMRYSANRGQSTLVGRRPPVLAGEMRPISSSPLSPRHLQCHSAALSRAAAAISHGTVHCMSACAVRPCAWTVPGFFA